jgi:hypothetical protein
VRRFLPRCRRGRPALRKPHRSEERRTDVAAQPVIPLPLEHWAPQTIVGTRVVQDLHFYLTANTFDLAQDLVFRGERCPLVFLGRDRHQVAHDESSTGAPEGGLENVGLGEVAALGPELTEGPNTEAPSLPSVQQGGEDGGAVEARKAEPVERALPGDETRASAVADESIAGAVFEPWIYCSHWRRARYTPTRMTAPPTIWLIPSLSPKNTMPEATPVRVMRYW